MFSFVLEFRSVVLTKSVDAVDVLYESLVDVVCFNHFGGMRDEG